MKTLMYSGKKLLFVLILGLICWAAFPPIDSLAFEHYDFTYPDRASLIAAGWDFLAVTTSGGTRNTEQTTGAVVSYDQVAHPGILRIPTDVGDLWGNLNNTRNMLLRSLPSNWTSIRLKLNFAPAQNYQQAGLLAYQDDDNYVQVTRNYSNGNYVAFVREIGRTPSTVREVGQTATTNLHLRLDRDPATQSITGYYSLDGSAWTSLGSVTQTLNNPHLAIFVGASPGGFPNADLAWVEVDTSDQLPASTLFLSPSSIVFVAVEGETATSPQTVNILHEGFTSLDWTQASNQSWLSAIPVSGATPGSLLVAVNPSGLAPGVYSGAITISAPAAGNTPQQINVNLLVNPINPNTQAKVATWKDGHRGAMSVSVDDGYTSCFENLNRNGFAGTYFTDGSTPPSFYTDYYNDGMEIGSHTTNHICADVGEDDLRNQEILPNILGICTNTPEPCPDVISFAWPCGFTSASMEAVASDYFLSARGYNFNQLEDVTPSDFLNLRSYNSHYHTPYPPADLRTVVDLAVEQGRWAILVFHQICDDNGAIDYSATTDVWVAPIGTVVKYILQRDRTIFANYQENSNQITFSFSRLPMAPSPVRSFETAFGPTDTITLQIDVDEAKPIASVRLNGASCAYTLRTIDGNKVMLIDTTVDTNPKTVEVVYQSPTSPVISVDPTSLAFDTIQGTNPTSKTITLANAGEGILTWTATADAAAPAWLSVTPTSGSGNVNPIATLTVSVNSAGLSPATYTKAITISAPGATNTPQTVTVTLTVNALAVPTISLNPNSLVFNAVQGTSPTNQTVSLTNAGGGTLTWTATADAAAPVWLSVTPTSGVGNATLTVSVNSAGLSSGTYTKAITIAATGATNTPQTVNVTLTINNPVPTTTNLSPTSATAGGAAFTLTVNGSGFVTNSVVRWNGSGRATTYVSATQLTASILASDIAVSGTASVTVFNPTPGGGTSNAQTFTINNPDNPVPATTSLSPSSATAGGSAFTLTVNGTNFVSGSVVRWNGSGRATTYVSATQLTASILASDIAVSGTASVTVFNPTPGGGASNAQTFAVNNPGNPVPTTTGLSPSSATAGSSAFTLTVNGTNFVSGSVVRWGGSDRTTTYVSATQLTASIPASDIAVSGTAQVTVFNPTPGGGASNAQTFAVNNPGNPVPTITSLSPSSRTAGRTAFTLTVNGSSFVTSSVVRWNGADRPTTFVSSARLTAAISASDIVVAGTAQVTVFSPAPGGGTSNALTLTINNPVPTISSLSPATANVGRAGFTLTVNGSSFVTSSVVRWNGADRPTTFVSSARLTAAIPPSDIVVAGTAQVTVFSPAPGGGTSNARTFTINNPPVPTITSLSPSSRTAGRTAFTLTVNGSGFVTDSVVQWNGANHTTTFVSATRLRAAIPAADIAVAGTAQVTVLTPAPGGGTSNALTFTIN